jgi:hypothetical protein
MSIRKPFALLLLALCAAGVLAQTPMAKASRSSGSAISFDTGIKPLLSEYCFACHGNGKKKGDIVLDQWNDEAAAVHDPAIWQRVLKMIQHGEMPPENKPQPSAAERARLMKWIETKVFQFDCEHPDPGRAPIRRLNRAEYNNTIRDLLGVDFKPAEDFPVDDSGHGFDNMADALSMPPLMVEKYLAAAEKIVNAAFVLTIPPSTTNHFPIDALELGYNARQRGDGWVSLNSVEEDDVAVNFQSPISGEFAVRVRAYAIQESSNAMMLTFMLGDQPVKSLSVQTNAANPWVYETMMKLALGTNRVRVVVRRVKSGLSEAEALKWKTGPQQKGAVLVNWLEIEGPETIDPILPETHRRVFVTKSQIGTDHEIARDILGRFASRAFRRPVTSAEVNRLVQLAQEAWQRGETFEQGVARAIQATLVSPYFLFRSTSIATANVPTNDENALKLPPHIASSLSVKDWKREKDKLVARKTENSPKASADKRSETRQQQPKPFPVDEFTLASRLSYFLWSSMPDGRLFALAEKNLLRTNLEAEVRRMLGDAKSRALVDNFAGQWLQIRNLELVTPDKELFPKFDEELRRAMRTETELLFANVMQTDSSILDFLRADYTYVNERLAKHYGVTGVKGPDFERVSLSGTPRRGVLTHASILALTSNPTRTSPVKRGKWVLETLLNAPPPPPPPGVPELKEGKELTGTLRQRMEEHRANPLCASCHARMDPIGFALENFDAIGAWRDQDGKEPIDASGELATGETIRGSADLATLLVERKKEQFARAFAEKLLIYALGRGVELSDKCALDEITRAAAAEDYRFSSVAMAIVKSVPFQNQRGANAPPSRD